MLVEINLLPQKEPKKYSFIIGTVGVALAFLIIGGFYFYQIHTTKNEIAQAERQIEVTQKVVEKVQNESQTNVSTDSVSKLKEAIDWAKSFPIQTVPVMDHLSALLPNRGFIQTFSYTEAGTISLTVQFDTQREAAYFLNSLLNADWITNATLNSLSSAEIAGSTGAETEDTTAITTDQTVGTNTEQDSNQSNNTSQNTGGTSNVTNTSGTSTTTTAASDVDPNILPRYTGQFEITLNKEGIQKWSKEMEEGVTGS